MSIRELFREFVAAKRKRRADLERDLSHAWYTANLAGAAFGGKFPDLKTVLEKSKPPVPQTAQEQRSALESIASTMGLKLYKRSKKGLVPLHG